MHKRSLLLMVSLSVILATLLNNSISLSEDQPVKPSPNWNVEQGIELPIGKTPWEIENEHLFPIIYPPDEPPPPPVVNPAEWEPMTGALIRYPLGLSYSLIAEMAENVEVMTIVTGLSQMNTVYNLYQNNGVNVANCTWLFAPSNSMWTRDYGPWYIFQGENIQGITDHIYNRPTRPQDDNIPWVLGDTLNIPVYGMPVIHTGGNYMSTGMGVSMSTTLVYDENPNYTQAEVDEYMYNYVGVEDYVVMEDILTYGIHHIDCWAKLIDPGRLVVKLLDPPNAQLEANVDYLESLTSPYERTYEVIRVSCASSTPYTNALILNNKVLVPLFNNPLDPQAMATWTQAMPGYEILGFTGSWVSDDAIHCRVMGMTDRYMLRIVHIPLHNQENTGLGYPVEANIHAYSNMSILPDYPVIMWKVEGGAYNSALMTYQGNDIYQGYIPQQPDYTEIYYYIHCEDASGRRENHPYIGAGNPHHFTVAPDTIPPVITHNPMPDISVYEWPVTIGAYVTDNLGVEEVWAEYSINGVPMPNVTLVPAGSVYAGQLVGTVQLGDEIEYRIGAMDVSVNANTSYSPATGMYEFEIVPGYMSDFEDGSPGWTHSFITPGFTDEWHLSTQRNHTVGGSYSWKCGSTGTGNYANLLDAGLVSTEYSIGNESRLSFWHYINAETSSSYPGYAYDGGLVEISIDGGAWTQIEPIGGYPYLVRIGTTPGPFPEDTPIFSGSSGDWEQVSFNLAGYSGSARFRFRFGSDGSVNMEGWYIDDVLVVNAGTGASPILVELTPINPPIIIPPTGGNFSYTVEITNVSGNLVNFDGWIEIMLPDSSIYGPLFLRNVNLQAGASINRTSVQVVPANAPAGTYQYILNGGIYPAQVWDSDSFPFVKQ